NERVTSDGIAASVAAALNSAATIALADDIVSNFALMIGAGNSARIFVRTLVRFRGMAPNASATLAFGVATLAIPRSDAASTDRSGSFDSPVGGVAVPAAASAAVAAVSPAEPKPAPQTITQPARTTVSAGAIANRRGFMIVISGRST